MKNTWASIGAFSMAMAVALGAYNAHGMESLVNDGKIAEKYLATFHTGVLYQFISSLGILLLSVWPERTKKISQGIGLIFAGMCIFSFSLYILSFNEILGEKLKVLGAVTPIGGLAMIGGWIWVGMGFLKTNKA